MTEHDGDNAPPARTNPWIGPEAPKAPRPGGWSDFDSGTPWNDMKVPAPGANQDEPARTPWGAPAALPEQDQTTEWFIDDVPAPSAEPAAAGLPRRLPTTSIPALITFATLCLGLLLIASSIIWHPQAP